MMDATNVLIHDKMGEIRELLWERDKAAQDFRVARREPGVRKRVMRARSKSLMAALDEEIREEYVDLRDMLNAALGDE